MTTQSPFPIHPCQALPRPAYDPDVAGPYAASNPTSARPHLRCSVRVQPATPINLSRLLPATSAGGRHSRSCPPQRFHPTSREDLKVGRLSAAALTSLRCVCLCLGDPVVPLGRRSLPTSEPWPPLRRSLLLPSLSICTLAAVYVGKKKNPCLPFHLLTQG